MISLINEIELEENTNILSFLEVLIDNLDESIIYLYYIIQSIFIN